MLHTTYSPDAADTADLLTSSIFPFGTALSVDAFTYVQRHYAVHTVIDCATLTLGVWNICSDIMSAAFANDDALYSQLQQSGERVSERLWRFPVWKEHRELLKNTEGYSDWKNYVGKVGESCTAAAFLELFIDDGVKWAHSQTLAHSPARPRTATTALALAHTNSVLRALLVWRCSRLRRCVNDAEEDQVAVAVRHGLRSAAVLRLYTQRGGYRQWHKSVGLSAARGRRTVTGAALCVASARPKSPTVIYTITVNIHRTLFIPPSFSRECCRESCLLHPPPSARAAGRGEAAAGGQRRGPSLESRPNTSPSPQQLSLGRAQ